MGKPAPDAVKRLVDLSACNAQADRFDQDRKVFLSPDYKEEQLRAEFLNDSRLPIRHSDSAVRTCLEDLCLVARHSAFVVRIFSSPFFSALGWDRAISLTGVRSGVEDALLFPAIIGDAGL